MIKIGIRAKILLALVAVLAITLLSTDLLWYRLIKPILMDRLASVQTQIVNRGADTINQFILTKKRSLIIHSQSAAFLTKTTDLQRLELLTFFTQDENMDSVTYLDETGKEQIKLTRNNEVPPTLLKDRSQTESFKATTFQYGKEYISNSFIVDEKPKLTIAVPVIVPNTTQNITTLTTGTKRNRDDGEILGVLEATFDLTKLLNDITNLGGAGNGVTYIVDRNGLVVAHKLSDQVPAGTDLSALQPIAAYKLSRASASDATSAETNFTQYTDQNNIAVMGSQALVSTTAWSVIVQQPVNEALAGLNQITQFALLLFIAGLFITFPLAYLLSRRLTAPLAELVKGAQIIGRGNFDYKPPIKSHDEIADLADAFYQMAQELKGSILSLQTERNVITEERNKLSVIIAGIQDAVIAVDLERRITLINRAAEELLGANGQELLGKPVGEVLRIYNGTDLIDVAQYCPMNSGDDDGVVFAKEKIKLINAKNAELYANIVAGKIKGGAAINLGCIITLHNVSKEMQLEEMKLDFVSMAAHELRTPLTAVRGYLSVFIMENASRFDEEQKGFLNRISISTQRLTSLVDNLLNVAKIERHGIVINPKPIDWSAHIKDLIVDFENYAKEQKVVLQFVEPTSPLPQISIDVLKIDEVLSNLVTNAITYTKTGGHVQILVELKNHEVVTSVKDDGPGIPETALPHLFTKFFRVSGKLEQGSKGTGLGLYISKAIVELHKGRIWVKSEFGHGSTFSFALPLDTPR